jgi:hypothetical protein
MDLGKLPAVPARSPDFGSGRVRINSAGAPRAGMLPPPDAPPGEPAGAIPSPSTRRRDDDRERQTGLNGTNAPMTVPPPRQSAHCSLADPACVLTDGSYSPFSPCLTDEPSNGFGKAQDKHGAECHRGHDEPRLS